MKCRRPIVSLNFRTGNHNYPSLTCSTPPTFPKRDLIVYYYDWLCLWDMSMCKCSSNLLCLAVRSRRGLVENHPDVSDSLDRSPPGKCTAPLGYGSGNR